MDEFRYVILHLLTTKEIPCLGFVSCMLPQQSVLLLLNKVVVKL